MSQVEEDRKRFLAMPLEEKRQFYKRERFTTLDQIATWEEFFEQSKSKLQKHLDGAIHKAAGPKLLNECKTLNGCKTGESKITAGYELPARYIIHTVGPQGEYPDQLESCYKTCLDLLVKEKLRSISTRLNPRCFQILFEAVGLEQDQLKLETTLSTPNRDTNSDIPVISSPFYCDHAATEQKKSLYFPKGSCSEDWTVANLQAVPSADNGRAQHCCGYNNMQLG
uniref:Macro domain-containing protein n=1 Tax=Timema shepardi TaxID=629360 RepID=A0A7R9AYP4_TIMSH|nr:unnamed protein product [Timema shepardi]